MERSYHEAVQYSDYNSRLEYLKLLDGNVTSPRNISGEFYKSSLWLETRRRVIDRDGRFDLGIFGLYIDGAVYVHHINPICEEDIINMTDKLTNPNNLICASLQSHNSIHYRQLKDEYVERRPGDTKFW